MGRGAALLQAQAKPHGCARVRGAERERRISGGEAEVDEEEVSRNNIFLQQQQLLGETATAN